MVELFGRPEDRSPSHSLTLLFRAVQRIARGDGQGEGPSDFPFQRRVANSGGEDEGPAF